VRGDDTQCKGAFSNNIQTRECAKRCAQLVRVVDGRAIGLQQIRLNYIYNQTINEYIY